MYLTPGTTLSAAAAKLQLPGRSFNVHVTWVSPANLGTEAILQRGEQGLRPSGAGLNVPPTGNDRNESSHDLNLQGGVAHELIHDISQGSSWKYRLLFLQASRRLNWLN